MGRFRSQSKSSQSTKMKKKKKECKSKIKKGNIVSGKVSKKELKKKMLVTKAKAKKIVSLKNAKNEVSKHDKQINLLEFPDEILLKIQPYLTFRSMCLVVITCKRLYKVLSGPSLWADMPLSRLKITKNKVAELYTIPRFAKIKHVKLDWDFMENRIFLKPTIVRNILEYSSWRNDQATSLVSLELYKADLWNIPTTLLVNAISQLKVLSLDGKNLTEENPENLAKALCQIPYASLESRNSGQTRSASYSICKSGCITEEFFKRSLTTGNVKTVLISYIDLSDISPDLLKKAICNFEDVHLLCTSLSEPQLTALLSFIPTKNKLKELYLHSENLQRVDPIVLARAVSHVPTITLKYWSFLLENMIFRNGRWSKLMKNHSDAFSTHERLQNIFVGAYTINSL